MATVKGTFIAVKLDELQYSQDQGGRQMVKLRCSYRSGSKHEQARFTRLTLITKGAEKVRQITGLGLPTGRVDSRTKIYLTVPFSHLDVDPWQGEKGPMATAFAFIDGPVTISGAPGSAGSGQPSGGSQYSDANAAPQPAAAQPPAQPAHGAPAGPQPAPAYGPAPQPHHPGMP